MIAFLSLIVCVIGLIIYLATNGKLSDVGRIMFGAGLLAFLLGSAEKMVTLLR